MKKAKLKYTKQGYSYITCTKQDCFNWGGMAICDNCSAEMEDVYLIFILGKALCKNCFDEWIKFSTRYEEDLEIQKQRHIKWYKAHGFDVTEEYETDNIKQELLKIANEQVNKKLEEERKKNEEKIQKEIQDVNFILELIEKKMLYKVINRWHSDEKFVMITKEMFLQDYTKEPEENWHKRGIQLKNWKGWKDSYDLEITINDEIKYYHIGYIVKDFIETLKDKKERIRRVTEGLNNLERDFEELQKQEKNIVNFVKEYNRINEEINKED